MRTLIVAGLMAIAALSAMAATDVSGTWKGSLDTQIGPVEMTIVLKAGQPLSGTVTSDQTGEIAIANAKLDGNNIHFEAATDNGTLVFDGKVSDDEIDFTLIGTTGAKYQLNCKRQK